MAFNQRYALKSASAKADAPKKRIILIVATHFLSRVTERKKELHKVLLAEFWTRLKMLWDIPVEKLNQTAYSSAGKMLKCYKNY